MRLGDDFRGCAEESETGIDSLVLIAGTGVTGINPFDIVHGISDEQKKLLKRSPSGIRSDTMQANLCDIGIDVIVRATAHLNPTYVQHLVPMTI